MVLKPPSIDARIAAIINEFMRNEAVPGMGVPITKDGKTVLDRGYGDASLPSGTTDITPVTDGTCFNIASVTKTFTGEAVLLLYQHPSLIKKPGIKSLNLDAPISTYLTNEVDQAASTSFCHRAGTASRFASF
jgi:CubicO group peptidase (beta-lactamase class C family)